MLFGPERISKLVQGAQTALARRPLGMGPAFRLTIAESDNSRVSRCGGSRVFPLVLPVVLAIALSRVFEDAVSTGQHVRNNLKGTSPDVAGQGEISSRRLLLVANRVYAMRSKSNPDAL